MALVDLGEAGGDRCCKVELPESEMFFFYSLLLQVSRRWSHVATSIGSICSTFKLNTKGAPSFIFIIVHLGTSGVPYICIERCWYYPTRIVYGSLQKLPLSSLLHLTSQAC